MTLPRRRRFRVCSSHVIRIVLQSTIVTFTWLSMKMIFFFRHEFFLVFLNFWFYASTLKMFVEFFFFFANVEFRTNVWWFTSVQCLDKMSGKLQEDNFSFPSHCTLCTLKLQTNMFKQFIQNEYFICVFVKSRSIWITSCKLKNVLINAKNNWTMCVPCWVAESTQVYHLCELFGERPKR